MLLDEDVAAASYLVEVAPGDPMVAYFLDQEDPEVLAVPEPREEVPVLGPEGV